MSEEPPSSPPAPLPDVAPASWQADRQAGESAVAFLERHYGPWLRRDGSGLSRPALLHLDPPLYRAFRKHVERHGPPSGFWLPTRSELVDLRLSAPSKMADADALGWQRDRMARYRRRRRAVSDAEKK